MCFLFVFGEKKVCFIDMCKLLSKFFLMFFMKIAIQ